MSNSRTCVKTYTHIPTDFLLSLQNSYEARLYSPRDTAFFPAQKAAKPLCGASGGFFVVPKPKKTCNDIGTLHFLSIFATAFKE